MYCVYAKEGNNTLVLTLESPRRFSFSDDLYSKDACKFENQEWANRCIEEKQYPKKEDNDIYYCYVDKVKMNQYRHFFLYSKGHYLQSDLYNDLKAISKAYANYEYFDEEDYIRYLIHAIKNTTKKNVDIFELNESAKSILKFSRIKDFNYVIIRSLLSIMSMIETENIIGDLGDPDYSILPSSDSRKEIE